MGSCVVVFISGKTIFRFLNHEKSVPFKQNSFFVDVMQQFMWHAGLLFEKYCVHEAQSSDSLIVVSELSISAVICLLSRSYDDAWKSLSLNVKRWGNSGIWWKRLHRCFRLLLLFFCCWWRLMCHGSYHVAMGCSEQVDQCWYFDWPIEIRHIVAQVCATLIRVINNLVVWDNKFVGIGLVYILMIDARRQIAGDIHSSNIFQWKRVTFEYRLWGVQEYRRHHDMVAHGRMRVTSRWCKNSEGGCWDLRLRIGHFVSIMRIHYYNDMCLFLVHDQYRYWLRCKGDLMCYKCRVMHMVFPRQNILYALMD